MILIYSLFQSRHSLATPGLPWGGEVTVKMKVKISQVPQLGGKPQSSFKLSIYAYFCLFVFICV